MTPRHPRTVLHLVAAALAVVGAALGATAVAGAPGAAAAGHARVPAWVRNQASVGRIPAGSHRLGRLGGSADLRAEVVLSPPHPDALAAFDTAVSTPGSPSFRHFLAPGAFASAFGPTPATIAAVRRWLSGRGLALGPTASDGLAVAVSGSAPALDAAFGTTIEQYRLPDGRVAHAPVAGPLVPGALAHDVEGVVGLDDVATPVPEMVRAAAGTAPGGAGHTGPAHTGPAHTGAAHTVAARLGGPTPTGTCPGMAGSGGLSVDELAAAYSFSALYPTTEGAGVTIGVYELEPFLPSDIATFESCYTPAITADVSATAVDGVDPTGGPGQGEAALDIEMAAGMAPQADVAVYVGPNGGSGPLDTYRQMIDDDSVDLISTSWGQCEAQTPPAVLSAESALFQQAAAQGQTVVAAAGDEGSEDCYVFPSSTDTRLQVDDPGSQPWVTSVGGTSLDERGPPPTESAWNDGLFLGSGGGGLSTAWTMPAWQLGPGVQNGFSPRRDSFTGAAPCPSSSGPGTVSCREVPDVSADADPDTGVGVYCTCFRGWARVGGTSMASPLWAALVALADQGITHQRAGFVDPALYQAGCEADPPFNDVTTGDNQPANSAPSDPPASPGGPYYPAGPGYDLATGLGTPVATALVTALRGPPDDCPSVGALSTSSGPAGGGTEVTVTGSNLSGVDQVLVGPGRPAAIVSTSPGAVSFLTPPSPTGGWATVAVELSAGADTLGADGALPFTYTGPRGYWTVASDGGIFAFGQMGFHGSMGGRRLDKPIVAMAGTPSSGGYWEVASDGGIFAFGDAGFYGSMGGRPLDKPVVAVAPTADGRGYWEVASDGGIFAYGDAGFYGSMGGRPLDKPIVGIAPTPDGRGYWEVASDGGLFAFGDAAFYGSMGGKPLDKPIVGMAATPDGAGYWEVASDGGIFAFGDAGFHGSTGGVRLSAPVVGMAATPDGNGYWLVASDGGIFAFGGTDGGFYGSMGGRPLARPMVGIGAPQGGAVG
ncbi:MAG TPA: protease pro-enzyme activation domain-containing protein [Acidimicrobiales bacterium]|nr:protease pro-enzyme activation domain-containing protein [Acidimicrobiales bacterium]